MKKIIFSCLSAVVFLMAGCTKEDGQSPDMRVTTLVTSEVYSDRATVQGKLAFNKNVTPEAIGFVYGTDYQLVRLGEAEVAVVAGEQFEALITGLQAETPHYVVAFADINSSRHYGQVVSFSTTKHYDLSIAQAASPVNNITSSSAELSGTIVDDSDVRIGYKGVSYWPAAGDESAAELITVNLSPANAPANGQDFMVPVTGLKSGTDYKARVWARNGSEPVYSDIIEFATLPSVLAEVLTIRLRYDQYNLIASGTETNLGADYVYLRGKIGSDGGAAISGYGIKWGSAPNALTNDVAGANVDPVSGEFMVKVNVAPGTIVWYAAYAINEVGTADATAISVATPSQKHQWKQETVATTVPNTGVMLSYWDLDPIDVGSGELYIFADRNLGAIKVVTDINATLYNGVTIDLQSQTAGMFDTVGDYYVFGNPTPAMTIDATTSTSVKDIQGVDQSILSVASNIDTDGNWTINQPCPVGYHIPTAAEWGKIIAKYQAAGNVASQFAAIKSALKVSGTSFIRPPYAGNPTPQFPVNYNQYSTFLFSASQQGVTSNIGSYMHVGYLTNNNTPSEIMMNGFSNANVAKVGIPVRCMRVEQVNP